MITERETQFKTTRSSGTHLQCLACQASSMLLVNITPQHTVVGLDRSVGTSNDCRRKMFAPFWDSMFRKSRNCSPDSVWCPRAKGLFVKCLVMPLIKQIKKIYHGLKVLVDKVKACYWKLNSFFRLAHNSTYLPFKKRLKIKKNVPSKLPLIFSCTVWWIFLLSTYNNNNIEEIKFPCNQP